MRLPEDVLRLVIEHLDPGEGLAVTQTLHSFCLASRLFLEIARPQLYSLVRIDDMRCKLDIAMVTMQKFMRDMAPATPETARPPLPWWMETISREKETTLDERRWKERKELKEKERAERLQTRTDGDGDLESRGEEEEEEDDDDREFWQTREVFDEGDEEDYCGREHDGLPELNPTDWGPSDILDPFSFTELRSLEAYPHLGQFVKTINFHGRVEGKPTAFIIERFLKVCPNVDTIVLARGDVRYIEDWLSVIEHVVAYVPNLTSLTITDFGDIGTVELFQAIAKLEKLRHLSLTCTPNEHMVEIDSSLFDPTSLPKSLRSFHLGSIALPDFYDGLPDSFVQSITSLGVAVCREIPDLTRFNKIEHLTITFGYFSHAVEALRTLSTSQTIKSVEVRDSDLIGRMEWHTRRNERDMEYDEYGSDEEEDEDVDEGGGGGRGSGGRQRAPVQRELDMLLDLFKYLPPNVESLSLLYGLDTDEFESAIGLTVPKSIRKLSLLSTMGEHEDDMFGDGESGAGTDEKPQSWLDDMSTLLREKGVELYRVSEEYGGHERSGVFRAVAGKKQ
ncbi:hypothetical protein JCM16303_006366 [Sporobolomyces ruberrimus]